MIEKLPDTGTKEISKALVRVRDSSGAMALGRVMTLLVDVDQQGAESAVDTAIKASRQHPSRIIALASGDARGPRRLDAQVRIGGDTGGSEVIVLQLSGDLTRNKASIVTPLLAADTPIVAWWTGDVRKVASSPIGELAGRRITDASLSTDPRRTLRQRRAEYADGDTDMAWSRTTRWRGLLATSLDLPPYESVTSVTVTGANDSASTDLLAGWLAVRLRCPVHRARSASGTGLVSVVLERAGGPIELDRPDRRVGTLTQPDQPVRHLDLTRPGRVESLAEELSRLGEDEVYREALVKGLPLVHNVSPARRSTTGRPKSTKARSTSSPASRKAAR